jgi:hypothetical protein
MSRSFTVENVKNSTTGKKILFTGGRYISENPSNAARKAFSQISKAMSGRFSLEITLRETTQNSKHKLYKYKVTRIKRPIEVIKDNVSILYKYFIKVKSV